LKAFCVDCFLDRIAQEVVRRIFVRCYCPGSSPGAVLARKFVHVKIAGEGAQPVRSLRFKNVDAHGDLISDAARLKAGNVLNGYDAKHEPPLNHLFVAVTENRYSLKNKSFAEPPTLFSRWSWLFRR
jgi:hypothetical protein